MIKSFTLSCDTDRCELKSSETTYVIPALSANVAPSSISLTKLPANNVQCGLSGTNDRQGSPQSRLQS
jgi:hypothetical protein